MSIPRRSLLVIAFVAMPVMLAAQLPLIVGRPANGRLVPSDPMFPDSTHYKMYAFTGNRGDTVTVSPARPSSAQTWA